MEPAAVGFQCPECVASGRKQTRSGRTAYGGRRSANPAQTSLAIIVANAAVWLLILATGWRSSPWADRFALVPRGTCAVEGGDGYYPQVGEGVCRAGIGVPAEWINGVTEGAPWQLVSSMFTHVEIWHIGFNMLALWVLGPQLELAIGRARFLGLYLLSGLAGSALVYGLAAPNSMTLGASGAVYGLMAALLVVAFRVGGQVQVILGWIAVNAVLTFVGGFSWQGHLGGFLGGLALMGVIVYAPRGRRTLWQVTGFVVVGAVVAGAIVGRTVALA